MSVDKDKVHIYAALVGFLAPTHHFPNSQGTAKYDQDEEDDDDDQDSTFDDDEDDVEQDEEEDDEVRAYYKRFLVGHLTP